MEAGRVRVVAGTGTGPSEVASYDAALAEAGVHNYNLVTVSSIVPAGAPIEVVSEVPDLGDAGDRLTVVQAKATVEDSGRATAALGWTREGATGPGVFYETGGEFDGATARRQVERGLEHARELRDWGLDGTTVEVASVDAPETGVATTVVLAVYGAADPIL